MCRSLGTLPNSGGLFDQSPAVVERFSILYGILDKRENEARPSATPQGQVRQLRRRA